MAGWRERGAGASWQETRVQSALPWVYLYLAHARLPSALSRDELKLLEQHAVDQEEDAASTRRRAALRCVARWHAARHGARVAARLCDRLGARLAAPLVA